MGSAPLARVGFAARTGGGWLAELSATEAWMGKLIDLSGQGVYPDGRVYAPARGRSGPRERVEDHAGPSCLVADLEREQLGPEEFVARIVREMRIRFYSAKSVRAYGVALRALLGWYGRPPHEVTREIVRQYLECLVDGGAGSSWVSMNLSAARMGFDKMCGRAVTLGLMTPRRPKRLPVVLSDQEVVRLLEAAPSRRDKLALGIMYATGVRVGELVRLRWRDIDFDRRTVSVWQGKGRKDRLVMLPESFAPLLAELRTHKTPEAFIFAKHGAARHLSPVTIERIMARAVAIAGIARAFATMSIVLAGGVRTVQLRSAVALAQDSRYAAVKPEPPELHGGRIASRLVVLGAPLGAVQLTTAIALAGGAHRAEAVGRRQLERRARAS